VRKHWIFVLLAMGLLAVTSASAQGGKRESQLRTVHGDVSDKQENPVASAVVYLTNLRTLTVKTHITDDAGKYRFSGLDPNVDYEIHAETQEWTSAKRTISSLDSRKEIVVHLKLDKKKSEK
jgi:protocatechuate 3,4-dioxygenase beta subunit